MNMFWTIFLGVLAANVASYLIGLIIGAVSAIIDNHKPKKKEFDEIWEELSDIPEVKEWVPEEHYQLGKGDSGDHSGMTWFIRYLIESMYDNSLASHEVTCDEMADVAKFYKLLAVNDKYNFCVSEAYNAFHIDELTEKYYNK